jgi:hypothetical protein
MSLLTNFPNGKTDHCRLPDKAFQQKIRVAVEEFYNFSERRREMKPVSNGKVVDGRGKNTG